MITVRHAQDRGHAQHGWLDSHHTFSFADFHDPEQMGFRSLRVINEDRVQPGQGFGTHGHRDMEIFSYVLEGELAHQDSMGSGSTLRPGDVQAMSAGTGVMHSEANGSAEKPVHFLQIWIQPRQRGGKPTYEDRHFPEAERLNRLRPILAPDGREASLQVRQDVVVYAGLLEPERRIQVELAAGRHAWVQVARGGLKVNGVALQAGDGAAISAEPTLELVGQGERAELLFFDLA
jgi:redox-sensitive bicupin YhaK (pirin superfamily)